MMKKHVWMKSCGIAIGMILLGGSWSSALWIGQSQLNPFIEIQGTYETNIFQVNVDEDSDFVTVISPGIHFEFPTYQDSMYRIQANYRADIKLYNNNGDSQIDPDKQLNTTAHRLDGQMLFKFASGLQFNTGYILQLTSAAPDSRGDVRQDYIEHQPFVQVGYTFADRYEAQLRYDGKFRRYDKQEDEVDNLTMHSMETNLFYRLYSRFSLLAGGGYHKITREQPFSDSTELLGFGGVRYEVTETTTGTVKLGAERKNFDNAALKDTTQIFASGEVEAAFSDTSKMSLRLYRNIAETSVAEGSEENGAYYVVTGIDASMIHTLAMFPNLSLSGMLTYRNEKYPEDSSDRSDNHFEMGGGADYTFLKYLTVGASYKYSTTSSNIDVNDYVDHILMMKLRGLI